VRRIQLTAVLAVALLALVAGQARASSESGSVGIAQLDVVPIDFGLEPDPPSRTIVDPRSAYQPSDWHSLGSGVNDVSFTGSASTSGCRTKVAWIGSKNILGTYLWKYFQKLGWCWRRGVVTSATPRCRGTWAEVYFPLWDFKGHIGCDSSGGVGQSFVRRWRQGKFQLCAAYCVQTKTPWVNVRGTGSGVFSWSAGM
jgi:hypothetical protein